MRRASTPLCLALVLGASACAIAQELQARRWFNNPVFRLKDDRKVVLFFFKAEDEAARFVPKLNRLAERRSYVVVGLTRDPCEEVERFISRYKVGFTVGCESGSARAFKIDRLPALLLIERAGDASPRPLQLEDLDGYLAAPVPGARIELPDDPDKLMEQIMHGPKGGPGAAMAVWKLFRLTDREAFNAFAAQQLQRETDPWVRGALKYLSTLTPGADPDRDRPGLSPSATYMKEFHRAPQAPEWAEVRAFLETMEKEKPPPLVLLQHYYAHGGDDPKNVVIRRYITEELKNSTDRAAARAALVEIVGVDPDFSIRLVATMGLGRVCQVGDTEIADYLEGLAASEPHLLNVRPMMEYVSEYLRTGEENVARMPPRP